MIMRRTLLIIGLLILSITCFALECEQVVFEQPVIVTSAGQSPGALQLTIVAKMAKIEHTFEKLFDADQFEAETYKTLIIVVGASGKGLGAAGIEIEAEFQRVLLLAQKAKENGVKVIVGNLEGESRRGPSSDEILMAIAPYADALFAKIDANQDDFFSKISEERSIPLKLFEKTVDLVEVLNEFFVK